MESRYSSCRSLICHVRIVACPSGAPFHVFLRVREACSAAGCYQRLLYASHVEAAQSIDTTKREHERLAVSSMKDTNIASHRSEVAKFRSFRATPQDLP